MTEPQRITSRTNPLWVALRRVARDGSVYRRSGQVWLEGDHLCSAALARGWPLAHAVLTDGAWALPERRALALRAGRVSLVPEALFAELSTLESPADLGALLDLPAAPEPDAALDSVVLDRLQDAGNAGSILRSAAALGVGQVLALKGTVALWSPKVLRAGMGAHFGLRLLEGLDEERLLEVGLSLVGTSSHGGLPLHQAPLPRPAAWLFGHEGQGVAAGLLKRSALTVAIPQPGGEESLNVAAAAAICLYEGLRQRL